jgi:hypothetical protein
MDVVLAVMEIAMLPIVIRVVLGMVVVVLLVL